MGLNSRKSMDPRWPTQTGSKVAAGFMAATIKVIRKTPGAALTYDQTTRTYTGGYDTIWAGPARVQMTSFSAPELVAQDQSYRQTIRIQVAELATGINVDDVVQVIESPYNPALTKFRITVKGTMGTSNAWLIDLLCDADQKHS